MVESLVALIGQQRLASLHEQRRGQIDGRYGLPGSTPIIDDGQNHNFNLPILR